MDAKPPVSLQHIPTSGALVLHSTRTGIFARGRRDAANSASDPHYKRGVAEYQAGNFTEAAASFRMAAEQGHAESQYLLSTLYETGNGVLQDDAEAAQWARRAAEQGHADAQASVSYRHYGAGELEEAFAWCQRAADSKLAWAEYNLGLMYRKGEGVAQSDAEAAYWYRRAAVQGHAEAQQRLADLYSLGCGMPRSYVMAAEWYRRAAEQGNAEAQFQLGHLYDTGLGVDFDYTEYRHWTRQAALQGHQEAVQEVKRREYRDP
jgi:TPR repeat protein